MCSKVNCFVWKLKLIPYQQYDRFGSVIMLSGGISYQEWGHSLLQFTSQHIIARIFFSLLRLLWGLWRCFLYSLSRWRMRVRVVLFLANVNRWESHLMWLNPENWVARKRAGRAGDKLRPFFGLGNFDLQVWFLRSPWKTWSNFDREALFLILTLNPCNVYESY